MGREAAGAHEPPGVGSVGVAGGDVASAAARVDELDDGGPQPEIGGTDVVDEDVVAATQRVPLGTAAS